MMTITHFKTGAPHELLGWRFGKQRAIRMGDWKLLDMGQGWQLYNLSNDIAEKHDLSQQEPAKLQELEAAYTKWNAKNIPAGWLMHGVPTKSRIPHRQQIDNMKDEGHERSAASGE